MQYILRAFAFLPLLFISVHGRRRRRRARTNQHTNNNKNEHPRRQQKLRAHPLTTAAQNTGHSKRSQRQIVTVMRLVQLRDSISSLEMAKPI